MDYSATVLKDLESSACGQRVQFLVKLRSLGQRLHLAKGRGVAETYYDLCFFIMERMRHPIYL